jgi:mono/diheme cytochrome c family protein
VVVLLLAAGCQQQMAKQPYYRPLEPSAFFADGRSARPLVPGTVARGHLRTDAHLFTGKENAPPREARAEPRPGPDREKARVAPGGPLAAGRDVETFPFPVTREVMERGRARYNIFCVVCHDPLGTGRGKIVERGYTPPPSFHIERLKRAPVGHFFGVISNGYGSMPDYATEVPVRDRWAIIAYIRALQQLTPAELEQAQPELGKPIHGGGQR